MSERAPVKMLVVLCLGALVLRVGAVVMLRSWEHPVAMEHRAIAKSLLAGTGFSFRSFDYFGPSSVQSPTFPFLLAGGFALFGDPGGYVAVMVLNCVLGAACVWLTWAVARAMGATVNVALAAAALTAAWPTQVYAVTVVQAIVLITAVLLLQFLLLLRFTRAPAWPPLVGLGLAAGLGALTEPVLLPALPLTAGLLLVWRGLPPRWRLVAPVVFVLLAALVIFPWTVRNRVVHGRWIPVKSTFWHNTWKGNNPHATGTDRLPLTQGQRDALAEQGLLDADALARDPRFDSYRQFDLLTREQKRAIRGKPEPQREKMFAQWTKQWIAENPGGYARLAGVRVLKTVWLEWDNPKGRNLAYVVARTVLVVLSAIGLVLAVRRGWRVLYPLAVYGSCLLMYALTIAAARFSITFEPLQLALAAFAVFAAVAPLRRRPAAPAATPEASA